VYGGTEKLDFAAAPREETHMKVIYIAGPYRAPTAWGIAENVRAAERVGLEVARAGAMPLIPHANTAHFHGECTDELWIEGTLELLRRCDAAVFLPNWHHSTGSRCEWAECMRRDMPRLDLDFCMRRHMQRLDLDHYQLTWAKQKQAIGAFVRQLGKAGPV
jgi:hypothetical protein